MVGIIWKTGPVLYGMHSYDMCIYTPYMFFMLTVYILTFDDVSLPRNRVFCIKSIVNCNVSFNIQCASVDEHTTASDCIFLRRMNYHLKNMANETAIFCPSFLCFELTQAIWITNVSRSLFTDWHINSLKYAFHKIMGDAFYCICLYHFSLEFQMRWEHHHKYTIPINHGQQGWLEYMLSSCS